MPTTSIRSSPSGNLVDIAVTTNEVVNLTRLPGLTLQQAIAFLYPDAAQVVDALASGPITLVLRPAGHLPGLYLLALAVVIRTGGPGSMTRLYQFTAPSGPAVIGGFGPFPLNLTGAPNAGITTVAAASDGSAPITLTLTPSTSSSARLDAFATAYPLAGF